MHLQDAEIMHAAIIPSIEIIVVDDGSTDNTIEVVRDFHSKNSPELKRRRLSFKFVRQDNGGKARPWITAEACAREFIVTIDAIRISATRESRNHEVFVAKDVGRSQGMSWRYRNIKYWLFTISWIRAWDCFPEECAELHAWRACDSWAFSAYRRSALNYFEEGTLTEDFDTSVRIIEKDYKIVQAVDAVCYTQLPMDVHDLMCRESGGSRRLASVCEAFEHKKESYLILRCFRILLRFYGIFRDHIFCSNPSMLLSGGYSVLTVILVFFLYSVCILLSSLSCFIDILKTRGCLLQYLRISSITTRWYSIHVWWRRCCFSKRRSVSKLSRYACEGVSAYCMKCAVFFIALRKRSCISIYSTAVRVDRCPVSCAHFEPAYFMSFLASFFIFLYFSPAIESEFIVMFFYMANIFVNMLIVMIYLRMKYDLREAWTGRDSISDMFFLEFVCGYSGDIETMSAAIFPINMPEITFPVSSWKEYMRNGLVTKLSISSEGRIRDYVPCIFCEGYVVVIFVFMFVALFCLRLCLFLRWRRSIRCSRPMCQRMLWLSRFLSGGMLWRILRGRWSSRWFPRKIAGSATLWFYVS